jgi:hypothetical protein
MCFINGFCNDNARTASRDYQHWCLDQRKPTRHAFASTHCSLRETGEFMPLAHVVHGRCNGQIEEEVLMLYRNIYLLPFIGSFAAWYRDLLECSLPYTAYPYTSCAGRILNGLMSSRLHTSWLPVRRVLQNACEFCRRFSILDGR